MIFDFTKFNTALHEYFGVRMFTDFLEDMSKEFIRNLEREDIDFDDCQVVGHDWPLNADITLKLARFGADEISVSLGSSATSMILAHINDCLEDL